MEYKKISYFITVAETLSFTRAAERLFVSQQTITKQIAQLEEELGVKLLERTTRSVSLTPIGKLCYEKFSVINAEIDDAVAQIKQATAQRAQQISVGFFSSFSSDGIIRPIMDKLRDTAPDVVFNVQMYDLYELQEKLFEGDIDICITTSNKWRMWKDVTVKQRISEPFYIVLSSSHPLAKKSALTDEDLKSETFFRIKNAGAMSAGTAEPPMACKDIEYVDNFSTLKMRLDLGQGYSALTRVFEGAYDPRFVYFPMPPGKQYRSEVICAFRSDDSNPLILSLASALEELDIQLGV